MRKFVVLALALAVLFAGWWGVAAFLANPAPPARDGGKTPSSSKQTPPRNTPPPQSVAPAGRASRASDGAKPPSDRGVPGGPMLHGTLVGVDESAVEHRDLDGRFVLHWIREKQPRSLDVEVHGGRFATETACAGLVGINGVVLGQRLGRLADFELDVPPSGEVALRVQLIPASSLRVVDAATRAELGGIDVDDDLDPMGGPSRLAPRSVEETAPVATGARSPIVLPPVEGTTRYWVHVKGYARSLVQVQHLVGGEREVPLGPGGTLAIRLLQKPEREDLELAVRCSDDGRSFKAAVTAAARDLIDVAPGHYLLEATIAATGAAAPEDARTVVAHAECDVTAHATTHVELPLGDVPSAPAVVRVPFRGLVVGADARLTMGLSARLSSLDPAQRVAGPNRFLERPLVRDPARADAWSFDFGTVVPGRKLVTIQPLQVHRILEVGAEGLIDARIDLPELGEVEVEVTDAATGAAIANAGVTWRSARHPMADDDLPQSAATRGDPPVARFLAPLGSITVRCWPDGYTDAERELEVLASLQRVTLAVGHEQYVRVVFRQGSSVVPIDPGSMVFNVAAADGVNHAVGWAKEAQTGALRLIIDHPGDYTVRFPKLAGFRAPADRTVHVESGGTTQLEVALELE